MANALLALSLTLCAIAEDGAPASPVPDEAATSQDTVADESPPEPAYSVWDALAQCESSGRWHIANPPYYGGLQEDLIFWRRHGGLAYASRPDLASREAQIAVAEVGLAVQGPRAWPVCGPRVGLHA